MGVHVCPLLSPSDPLTTYACASFSVRDFAHYYPCISLACFQSVSCLSYLFFPFSKKIPAPVVPVRSVHGLLPSTLFSVCLSVCPYFSLFRGSSVCYICLSRFLLLLSSLCLVLQRPRGRSALTRTNPAKASIPISGKRKVAIYTSRLYMCW